MVDKKMQIKQPRYQLIAEDIATKIVERKYVVGEKIYARSSLASQYGVSPETTRRAIAVLQDLNIVEATKGSGVEIVSYENAAQFVHRLTDVKSVRELQSDLEQSILNQKKELANLQEVLQEFVSRTSRLHSINPFVPFQVGITADCPYLSQNIGSIKFWQQTGATIIGIKKGEDLIISPGPYAELQADDTLYFIGDDHCFSTVKQFLNCK